MEDPEGALGASATRLAPLPGELGVEERRRREAARYQKGHSIHTVAAEFGVTATTVSRDLKTLDVPMRNRSAQTSAGKARTRTIITTQERRDRAAILYLQGFTVNQIAEQLGFYWLTIHKDLQVRRVPKRPTHRRHSRDGEELAERRRRAIDLYRDLGSLDAVASELGIAKSTLWIELKDAGVIRRLEDDEITVEQASEEYGLKSGTLATAIDAGRVPGERIISRGLVRRVVKRVQLERCIAEMRCAYHGCNEVALGASGGCESHGHAIEQAGRPRERSVRRRIVKALIKYHGPAMRGRHAKLLAEGKGVKVGSPPILLTDEKKKRILQLRQEKSQRQVAYITGVSRGSVRHVETKYLLSEEGELEEKVG